MTEEDKELRLAEELAVMLSKGNVSSDEFSKTYNEYMECKNGNKNNTDN